MSDVKVSRDGTVTRDGVTIGRVEKVMRQGLFATAFGASYSGGDGTPYWVPFLADGTQLDETGYDTRKRAVALVEKVSRPTEVSGLKVERSGDVAFVSAHFVHKGHVMGVSRYAGEASWGIDFYMSPGAFMPAWSNGSGARYLRVRGLNEELAAIVTAAAEAAGVWPIPSE